MSRNQEGAKVSEGLMGSAHLDERREERYDVAIAIEVRGFGRNGRIFQEKTSTTNVSAWGCAFHLTVELEKDSFIEIRPMPQGTNDSQVREQTMFQVVRVTPEASGWLIGAWKLEDKNPWGNDLAAIGKRENAVLESRKNREGRAAESEKGPG